MPRNPFRSAVVFSLLLVGMLVQTGQAGQREITANAQPATNPIRIGFDGTRLTDPEVTEMVKVLPEGGRPWLINGDGPGAFPTSVQRFHVYMSPLLATPEIRRGVYFEVNRPIGSPSAWSIRKNAEGQPQTYDYAQVAIAGRPFDQVVNENDPNRPFHVGRGGDYSEMVSLVQYVRSLYPTMPISLVSMHEPLPPELQHMDFLNLRVIFRETSTSGTVLSLRKAEKNWEILATGVVNQ